MKRTPLNKMLYSKLKKKAKHKFDVWPSAYASGWLVQEYKKKGGQYAGTSKNSKLARWFLEKWIDVCKLPEIVPCGRKHGPHSRKYPYCRPMYKVSKGMSPIASSLSHVQIKRICAIKQSNPHGRINAKTRVEQE
jgi:hypothetical protein